jgi:hypothetical protein
VTKLNLLKLHGETVRLSEEFGVELRAAYAIDIVDSGGVMWMIPEKWFFRYLRAFETLVDDGERRGDGTNRASIIKDLDEEVEYLIKRHCAARHQ